MPQRTAPQRTRSGFGKASLLLKQQSPDPVRLWNWPQIILERYCMMKTLWEFEVVLFKSRGGQQWAEKVPTTRKRIDLPLWLDFRFSVSPCCSSDPTPAAQAHYHTKRAFCLDSPSWQAARGWGAAGGALKARTFLPPASIGPEECLCDAVRMPSTRSREQPYAFATLWHDVICRLQLPPSILTCRENHAR